MNQNISYEKKASPVSIFKLDITKKMPFYYEMCYTATSYSEPDDEGNRYPIESKIYRCEIGDKSAYVRNGDYIVIGKRVDYRDGHTKEVEWVECHTQHTLVQNFAAFDVYEDTYVDIFDSFNDKVDDEKEPTYQELKHIEEDELEQLMYESQHLTIEDLLDDEEL